MPCNTMYSNGTGYNQVNYNAKKDEPLFYDKGSPTGVGKPTKPIYDVGKKGIYQSNIGGLMDASDLGRAAYSAQSKTTGLQRGPLSGLDGLLY